LIDATTESYWTRLRAAGLRGLPSDEWEIADIEQQLKVRLPAAYKAFLLLAGHGCEPLESSRYAIDDDLAALQRAGQAIGQRNGAALPQYAFVFFVHQGYACQFFLLQDGDDPTVYLCVDGAQPAERVAGSFSEWLIGELARWEEYRERRSRGA